MYTAVQLYMNLTWHVGLIAAICVLGRDMQVVIEKLQAGAQKAQQVACKLETPAHSGEGVEALVTLCLPFSLLPPCCLPVAAAPLTVLEDFMVCQWCMSCVAHSHFSADCSSLFQ